MKVDTPGQRQVLVEARPIAELGIVAGLVAEPGGRLSAEERRRLEKAVCVAVERASLDPDAPPYAGFLR